MKFCASKSLVIKNIFEKELFTMMLNKIKSPEERLLGVLTELRVNILRSITTEPKTAFQLSKELNESTSTIYRNLDVLGTYGFVQVYKLEPYKQVIKKYYMTTFKGFYVAFDYLKDLSYYFFATLDRYMASRWGVELQEKYVDEYAKISSVPKLVIEEHKLLKKFLRDSPFSIDDLNDIDTFLIFTIFALDNIQNKELKELELKKVEVLSKVIKNNKQIYEKLRKRLIYLITGSEKFLKVLESFLGDEG